NPFWTFVSPTNNGAVALDSSVAHTGSQSLELMSQAFGGQAYLVHTFSSGVYGTVEVYVYDSLATGLGYKYLEVSGKSPADPSFNFCNSFSMFHDWGNLGTYLFYPQDPPDPNTTCASTNLAGAFSSPGWRNGL